MPFRDSKDEYKKAARCRLADARELQMDPTYGENRSDAKRRHLRGSMYLAGYAAECLLKAYLIQQMNTQTLGQAMQRLDEQRANRGLKPAKDIAHTAAGHQISYIILLTDLESAYPEFDKKLWGRISKWQSSWRYESDMIDRTVATEFLNDVEAGVKWILPKVGS